MYNTAISKLTSFESDLTARLDKGDVVVLPVAAPTLAVLSVVSPLPGYKISHAENIYKQAKLIQLKCFLRALKYMYKKQSKKIC